MMWHGSASPEALAVGDGERKADEPVATWNVGGRGCNFNFA